MISIISRKDANGRYLPFDMVTRTCNRNSKTGGRLATYKNAKLLQSEVIDDSKLHNNTLVGVRVRRNPNHKSNRTFNIQTEQKEIKKVKLRLIVSVNAKKYVY